MTVTEDTDKKELLFCGELTLKETQKGVHEMSLVIENVSKQFKNSKKIHCRMSIWKLRKESSSVSLDLPDVANLHF